MKAYLAGGSGGVPPGMNTAGGSGGVPPGMNTAPGCAR